jgi:hypothetical protein
MEHTIKKLKSKVLLGFPELLKILSKGRPLILMKCLVWDTVVCYSTIGIYECFLHFLPFDHSSKEAIVKKCYKKR